MKLRPAGEAVDRLVVTDLDCGGAEMMLVRLLARRVAGVCAAVICGNEFLAEWFRRWNPTVHVLPTAVDTDRYKPRKGCCTRPAVIGWCGTSSGFKYLTGIERALAAAMKKHPEALLLVVSDRRPALPQVPASQIEFVRWSVEAELKALQRMTVGLMPLDDGLWSLGKCSYKMLLYMSCGFPVVASPVGMNQEILSLRPVGLGARTTDDWVEAIDWLLQNPEKAEEMGLQGRDVVLERFSLAALAPQLAGYLRSAAGR